MGGLKNIAPSSLNIISIFLVVALFPLATLLVKDYLIYRYSRKPVNPERSVASPSAPATDIRAFAPIIETGVFPSATRTFTPLAAAQASGVQAVDSPAALKGLKLIGTYVGPMSFAIIEKTSDSLQEAFRPGDRVFDAGTLKAVRDKSVEVLSGGRTTILHIPEAEIPPAPPVSQSGPASGRSTPPSPADSMTSPSGARLQYARKTGEREWALDQKAVLAALDDISSVLGDARLTPVLKNGDVQGFQITEIRPRGIFDALGLKNGDVLKRVNGFEVTSPEKAVQVLSAIKGETSINLDIVRGGANMSFHYEIR